MAMALHPDKLKLAHEELDRVVGVDRLPTISDRARLPYVNAIIRETMRWHPALPLSEFHSRGVVDFLLTTSTGIARCTSEDDLYEGYDIPKGTIVMPNVWYVRSSCTLPELSILTSHLSSRAIAFEKRGPYDPHAFVPERFLDKEVPTMDPSSWAFGFGRWCVPVPHGRDDKLKGR